MKYYAHIIKCSNKNYWYNNLIGEFVLIDVETHNRYGNYVKVIKLTDNQLKMLKYRNDRDNILNSRGVKICSEVELRLNKIKHLINNV